MYTSDDVSSSILLFVEHAAIVHELPVYKHHHHPDPSLNASYSGPDGNDNIQQRLWDPARSFISVRSPIHPCR